MCLPKLPLMSNPRHTNLEMTHAPTPPTPRPDEPPELARISENEHCVQKTADNLTDEQIDQFEAVIELKKFSRQDDAERYMQQMLGKPGHTPLAQGSVEFTNPRLRAIAQRAKERAHDQQRS